MRHQPVGDRKPVSALREDATIIFYHHLFKIKYSSSSLACGACVKEDSCVRNARAVLAGGHTVKAWKPYEHSTIEFDEDGKGGLYKEAAKLEWSEEREAFKKALLYM